MYELETKMEKIFNETDGAIDNFIKNNSGELLDSLYEMGDTEAFMLTNLIKLYKDTKELSLEMAKKIDKIDELNEKLDILLGEKH